MALSRLLAFASSARPADKFPVPAAASTHRTTTHFGPVLEPILNIYCIRSSALWLAEISGRQLIISLLGGIGNPGSETRPALLASLVHHLLLERDKLAMQA